MSNTVRPDQPLAVPPDNAPWQEIWEFAATYNAYDRHHGFDGAAEIGNKCADAWEESRLLPQDVSRARAALFFEQRRYHHFGSAPDDDAAEYIRSLLARIRELGDGSVPGPPDGMP